VSRRKEMIESHGLFPGRRSSLFPGKSPSIPGIPVARPEIASEEGKVQMGVLQEFEIRAVRRIFQPMAIPY
jgi:hypothetical protein